MSTSVEREKFQRMLEAFAYIAQCCSHKSNLYNVLKVFYLADKLHMERHGRFIFNERYAAMKKGPVPSDAYNLMKAIRRNENLPFDLISPVTYEGNHEIVAKREFDDSLFSDSDLECIDEIVEVSKTQDLGELSHDNAWKNCMRNGQHFMPEQEIIGILHNADLLLNLQENRFQ